MDLAARSGGRQFTVIGASGFIGGGLVPHLRARGHAVAAPARDEAALFEQPLGHVVYCAGLTADFQARPFDTIEAHVGLLARLLQRARFESLVYLSSTRLYDSLGPVDAHEALPLRLDPGQPRHLYDLSKALGESLCHTTGLGRARIARLACVYDGMEDADGFVPALLRQVQSARHAAQGRPCALAVNSSPGLERDYVHLPDVLHALECIAVGGQQSVYNIASGANVRNAELFDYIERRWNCRLQPQHDAQASAPHIRVDRMREEFGWQASSLWSVLDSFKDEL